jgi:hypothetical protein
MARSSPHSTPRAAHHLSTKRVPIPDMPMKLQHNPPKVSLREPGSWPNALRCHCIAGAQHKRGVARRSPRVVQPHVLPRNKSRRPCPSLMGLRLSPIATSLKWVVACKYMRGLAETGQAKRSRPGYSAAATFQSPPTRLPWVPEREPRLGSATVAVILPVENGQWCPWRAGYKCRIMQHHGPRLHCFLSQPLLVAAVVVGVSVLASLI